MKARTIGYWTTTALVGFAFVAGGIADLVYAPPIAEAFSHLGFPAYVATLLGAWKLLGALAILAPGAPRLKEWAYAGIAFDLSGAIVSHASVGDGIEQLFAPAALLALAIASWALRPGARKLPSAAPVVTRDPATGLGAVRAAAA